MKGPKSKPVASVVSEQMWFESLSVIEEWDVESSVILRGQSSSACEGSARTLVFLLRFLVQSMGRAAERQNDDCKGYTAFCRLTRKVEHEILASGPLAAAGQMQDR
jgi:hypothetical protein